MTKMVFSRLLGLAIFLLPAAAVAQREETRAYAEKRINQLRQSVTDLTGRIEQLQKHNLQLQQQLERMRVDYEHRLDRLEKGSGGRAAPPPKSQSMP